MIKNLIDSMPPRAKAIGKEEGKMEKIFCPLSNYESLVNNNNN